MRAALWIAGTILLAACGTDASDPVAWTRLAVRHGWGPCPEGSVCVSTWTLARGTDGQPEAIVTSLQKGIAKARTLSDAERAAIAKLLDDAAFRAGMSDGFQCAQVTDYSVTFTLDLEDGASQEQDVTGCVVESLDGPSALPRQIDGLVAVE